MWIRNPNSTIGSRPHRIVFVPRIPNKAPPVIKIIHVTSRKNIQGLWDYKLPLWCSRGLHSFGMLHGVGYWHFGTTYRFDIQGSSSSFFVGCLTLQDKGIALHLTSDAASHILQDMNPWYVNVKYILQTETTNYVWYKLHYWNTGYYFFHTAPHTYNFTYANKYSWQANKLLDIRAHLFCEAYTGTVYTTEERQLSAWKKKSKIS